MQNLKMQSSKWANLSKMKHSAEILELCFLQMLQVLQKWAINYYKIVHQSSMEKFSNIWMTFHRVWSSYFCLLFPAPPDFKEIIPCEHSWLLTCLVLLMEVWSLVNLLNETTWNSRLLNREKQGNWYLEHLLSSPKKKGILMTLSCLPILQWRN